MGAGYTVTIVLSLQFFSKTALKKNKIVYLKKQQQYQK